jgi:hypothetical protein
MHSLFFFSRQTLVSSILLRPHASDPNATMLSPTSFIRQRVEDIRVELLRWMKKRWVSIRMEGGFENLDPWALKEISHGKVLLFQKYNRLTLPRT